MEVRGLHGEALKRACMFSRAGSRSPARHFSEILLNTSTNSAQRLRLRAAFIQGAPRWHTLSCPLRASHSTAMSDEEEKPKFDDTQINLKVKDQARDSTLLVHSGPLHPRDAARAAAAFLGYTWAVCRPQALWWLC